MKLKSMFLVLWCVAVMLPVASNARSDEECKKLGDMASVIMVGRQGGIQLSKMLDGFTKEPDARPIILDAYEYPRAFTKDVLDVTNEEFRNKWELKCLKE